MTSRSLSEWVSDWCNRNTFSPLLNWVSFVLFVLKGRKTFYFAFAIWVAWEVLEWSQGPPDLNPCSWVCYLLCWEVRIHESAFESALHPLLEFQQWPQEHLLITGFFSKAFFQYQDQEKCGNMGRVWVAYTAKNTSSFSTVPFPPAHYVDWFWEVLSWYKVIFFALYFVSVENSGFHLGGACWEASETEGQP